MRMELSSKRLEYNPKSLYFQRKHLFNDSHGDSSLHPSGTLLYPLGTPLRFVLNDNAATRLSPVIGLIEKLI